MANATQSDVLGKFVWYDQMSNDLPGAEKFYSKVVGWSLAPNTMNAQKYTLLKAGETMVGGLMAVPAEAAKMGAPPSWLAYIEVPDADATVGQAVKQGAKVLMPELVRIMVDADHEQALAEPRPAPSGADRAST